MLSDDELMALAHAAKNIPCGDGWWDRGDEITRMGREPDDFIAACSPDVVLALVERVQRAEEAVTLLDRVEVSDNRETFDGTIAGGPPCDVDLFLPGPKYTEWARAVIGNRRARATLTTEAR